MGFNNYETSYLSCVFNRSYIFCMIMVHVASVMFTGFSFLHWKQISQCFANSR